MCRGARAPPQSSRPTAATAHAAGVFRPTLMEWLPAVHVSVAVWSSWTESAKQTSGMKLYWNSLCALCLSTYTIQGFDDIYRLKIMTGYSGYFLWYIAISSDNRAPSVCWLSDNKRLSSHVLTQLWPSLGGLPAHLALRLSWRRWQLTFMRWVLMTAFWR